MPRRKATVRQAGIVAAFAERLRATRDARGMTQRELADKAAVTFSYVSRLEAGGAAPGIDLVDRLARALGVHVTALLPAPEAEGAGDARRQVREQFEAMLVVAGPETLAMLGVLVTRLADSPAMRR